MYDAGPSDSELEAIGLTREDLGEIPDFEVWPDNWVPFKVFSEVCTQWRMGPGGPIGLDYSVVKWIMRTMHVTKKDRLEVLRSVRVLECSAMSKMAEANKKG